ncbi:hypothetical protein BDDG_03680 [Blastomyces dermatitidis ATCC 18188]|uniref:Uncharacterized protein n=1 Tax=Ajellomyces dermatitidis (strain ATCC 18188 / CBS 674.68) TaxID=653446 RepID=F2TBX6_AJEDA|nr:hypothetical protein BDDG_03680 [Blastomyces dermatitidis ATCC 18188]
MLTSLTMPEVYISACGAQHFTEKSANAGLDRAMPGDGIIGMGDGYFLWGQTLLLKVGNNQVYENRCLNSHIALFMLAFCLVVVYIPQDKLNGDMVMPASLTAIGSDAFPNPQGSNTCVALTVASTSEHWPW